ncbi:MAG TPA: VWA domain-containing protein [Bryobacteraceae bacterium]|nr:VWA domain-containing protein [Bryobacteraceae bacterium]
MRFWLVRPCLLLLAAAAMAPCVWPQSVARRTSSPTDHLRIDANLVLVPVTVTDHKDRMVTGLRQSDFRVYDGATEQPVTQFAEEDVPLSVGIVFDTSGSMRDKLWESKKAIAALAATANPEDQFFLVRFSGQPELAVPFAGDLKRLENASWSAQPSGKTALLDAICLALDYMRNARNPRKVMVIISDGGDNHSRYTRNEIRLRVRETDIAVYSIGIYDSASQWLPEQERGGPGLLTRIADESGGRHFSVERPGDIPELAAALGRELHNQYVLGFRPSAARRDGKYHRIQVKLRDGHGRHIYSRPGYYAAGQ